MDNFVVSARKYRPATFETVVGQQHITGTLKNAIRNNQLAQAFLFCGPRGVGKTTCARILAKTINCQQLTAEIEACSVCDSCKSFQQGGSFSIHELDAASNNSVDDIRSLIEQVRIPPQTGKYKIYIIDEVHMLSTQAFNAFLKTLEEPPGYAIFILATTEKHKILPTILSRCQIFDFNRIKVDDIANHLVGIATRESIEYDSDGLHLLAQKADGGLRDALSMFDQIVSFSNKQVSYQAVIDNLNILDYDYYFKVTDSILAEDGANALLILDDIFSHGFDGSHFIGGLASHFRNLLVGKDPGTIKLMEVSESIKQRYLAQAKEMQIGLLLSSLNIANQCEVNYRTSRNQRLQVELALLKMCHISSAMQLSAIPSEVIVSGQEAVKKKLNTSIAASTVAIETKAEQHQHADKAATVPENKVQTPKVLINQSPEISQQTEENDLKAKLPNLKNFKLSSSIPSLHDVFKDKNDDTADDEATYIAGNEQEKFTYEAFLSVWHAFADKAKQESKISLFTLMTANAPKLLDNFSVEIAVENAIQENLLQAAKIDILNEVRVKLRNFSIDLIPVQVEYQASKKPYTDQEKYNAMVEKNPLLDKLRQTFNLGFD